MRGRGKGAAAAAGWAPHGCFLPPLLPPLQLLTADQVEFWHGPEKAGWMYSQGEHIKTWRKRWFVLKQVRWARAGGAGVR